MANGGTGVAIATSPQHDKKNSDVDVFNHDLLINPGDVEIARTTRLSGNSSRC
jgi:hypothetical protein